MMENMIFDEADCVIEGEAILPELIVELREKFPDQLKVCFMGFTEIEAHEKYIEIKKFSQGENDWLTNESDDYILDHTKNMIAHSLMIKESCAKSKMKYFDTSKDFQGTLEGVKRYLMSS